MKTPLHAWFIGAWLPVLLFGSVSCATVRSLPPADISTPGWRVQSGQAVWQPRRGNAELAGDLVMATSTNGDFFVQFSKTPLPIVTAEKIGDAWQIEFGANEHHWQGQGTPPSRFAWFQLVDAMHSRSLTGNWQAMSRGTNSFKLQNAVTGESLEGEFFP